MHNWKGEIRDHLADLDLPLEAKEEVIAELASHLEDCEKDDSRPERSALAFELHGRQGQRLARAINHARRQEDGMNRAKALWLPMFVNLLLTSALLNLCDKFGMVDLTIKRAGHIPGLQPWLLTLPFCGALAALLARRASGSAEVCLIAALSPSIV